MALMDGVMDPVAFIEVSWVSAAAGGRASGPPVLPVYAPTCILPLGGEESLLPNWPADATMYSIVMEQYDHDFRVYAVDFLALDLVAAFLIPQAPILIMEGARIVAKGRIITVMDDEIDRRLNCL